MMNFLVLDDEPIILEDMEEVLKKVAPDGKYHLFSRQDEALSYAGENRIDVAFLDIEMGYTNGLETAKRLKELQPDIHIIFVTGHEQYAVEAFAIHATGYLVKPVMASDIRRELTFLYGDVKGREKNVHIQTFGGFSVLVDGEPLRFRRAKSKELLACLVDRRGADITTREACCILWEDGIYDRRRKNYFQVLLADLRETLRKAGIEDILVHRRNSLSVNPKHFDCDSYRFLDGDPVAVNSYRYNYLPSYSWAEFTVGLLENNILKHAGSKTIG